MNSQMKDMQGQIQKGPEHRATVSMKFGCVTLPVHGCVQPGSSPKPILLDFYEGFLTQA